MAANFTGAGGNDRAQALNGRASQAEVARGGTARHRVCSLIGAVGTLLLSSAAFAQDPDEPPPAEAEAAPAEAAPAEPTAAEAAPGEAAAGDEALPLDDPSL